MNKYLYNDFTIELFDDPTYTFGSADNKFKYLKHYFVDGGKEFPVSKYAVKILKGENEFIIHEDHLLLTDWNYAEYKLGFDGKLISSTFNRK